MPDFGALKDKLGDLLPVVSIFLLWLVFSFFGSKLRKQEAEGEQNKAAPSLQEKFLEMISPGALNEPPAKQAPKSDFERLESESARSLTSVKGAPPIVTAKPITPRWWGA
jgi:hypothetical protein